MNELTYTSPFTGRVYTIQTQTSTRMGGDWYAGEPLREITTTRYDFCFEGEVVTSTFSLDENYLRGVFGEVEGAYAAWATSARD